MVIVTKPYPLHPLAMYYMILFTRSSIHMDGAIMRLKMDRDSKKYGAKECSLESTVGSKQGVNCEGQSNSPLAIW